MKRILIVDSEEAAVERIVKILESNNYQAQIATTWTQAVDAIAHGQPDLVLVNLEMPIIRGDTLIEFIREEGFEVPVIVVLFPVEEAEAKALREQGIDGMVERPFEDKTLIKKIEQALNLAVEEDIEANADAEVAEAKEKGEEAEAPPEASSDAEKDNSDPFLKQPRDLRATPRTEMSKRKKVMMFTIIGTYILIGGFVIAMYFTDEVPEFVGQILSNW